MFNRIAIPFVYLFQRYMPNPFIFAALLSILTFALAVLTAGYSVQDTINAWGNSFWTLLTFSAQIAITLITGYALAYTPIVQKLLLGLANTVRAPSYAYAMAVLIAGIGSLISWGIGLVVGAVIAKEIARVCRQKNIKIHYPLLVASAYSGFVVWHMGLSSSIGLVIATEGHFLSEQIGIIPVSQTIFSYWNIVMALAVLLTLPIVMMLQRPPDDECIEIPNDLFDENVEDFGAKRRGKGTGQRTPAALLEDARIINILIGLSGAAYIVLHLSEGGSINLNIVNFSFLSLGILFSRSPLHYVELITRGGRTLGPILLQYPFYAGIMGMMLESGLAEMLSGWFVGISSAATLPFWAMISGGILNMFVPSGGGQWAVQGPIMIDAAKTLGADIPRVAMGVAIGDQWTNMIQPFWTIPALAIAGLHVRDVMGYTVIALFWSGIIFSLGLIFL